MQTSNDDERRLSRAEAAAFLSERGFRVAYATLNKYASVGGGPVFEFLRPAATLQAIQSFGLGRPKEFRPAPIHLRRRPTAGRPPWRRRRPMKRSYLHPAAPFATALNDLVRACRDDLFRYPANYAPSSTAASKTPPLFMTSILPPCVRLLRVLMQSERATTTSTTRGRKRSTPRTRRSSAVQRRSCPRASTPSWTRSWRWSSTRSCPRSTPS